MQTGKINYNRMAELHINKIDETVGIYAVSFLDAAARIFEHGICDFAPYPGMFCLRQGLELFVKQMTVYHAYEMRDKDLLYKKGHGLLPLWEGVEAHIRECVSDAAFYGISDELNVENVKRIDETIRHIHNVDPGGMLYRYPEDIVKGTGRIDTHFPEDRFYLPYWQQLASDLFGDCQIIDSILGDRCGLLQQSRGDGGSSLYDIVASIP